MTYSETLAWLYGLQGVGIKLGLSNITRLLAIAGDPQQSFRTFHVGGTNGKGSTCAFLASCLEGRGHRVGLFSSPHLVDFTERIRVNGTMISEGDVVRLAGLYRERATALEAPPTFFELTTAMAFHWFREQGVDRAVVEVGLGGRLDSTNIVRPDASVITNISRDHETFLGDTIEEIAFEKAGIIKPGVPVITGARGEAFDIVRETARRRKAPLVVAGRDFEVTAVRPHADGVDFDYRGRDLRWTGLTTALLGRHQADNAALALAALERAGDLAGTDRPLVERALRIRWPGRLEKIADAPPVYLDSAHNAAAARSLAEALDDHFPGRRLVLLVGVMKDKDPDAVLGPLASRSEICLAAAPAYARAAPAADVAAAARRYLPAHRVKTVDSVGAGLEEARRQATPDGLVLVTGSFFTTGEACEALRGPGILSGLRETTGDGNSSPRGGTRGAATSTRP